MTNNGDTWDWDITGLTSDPDVFYVLKQGGADITSYQIQVPIQPGNSGGPLFDFKGNLIGITSSGSTEKDVSDTTVNTEFDELISIILISPTLISGVIEIS